MKIDLGNIKQIASNFLSKGYGNRFGLAKNRDRDWVIILWSVLLISILISVLSFYMFYRINAGTIFREIDTENMGTDHIDTDELKDISNNIEQQKAFFTEELETKPETKDPSI